MALLGDKYSIQERKELTDALPAELRSAGTFGMYLDYKTLTGEYHLVMRQPGKYPKTLRRIPRSQMKNWTNPRRVMNYVARRALKDAGFTVDFRKP